MHLMFFSRTKLHSNQSAGNRCSTQKSSFRCICFGCSRIHLHQKLTTFSKSCCISFPFWAKGRWHMLVSMPAPQHVTKKSTQQHREHRSQLGFPWLPSKPQRWVCSHMSWAWKPVSCIVLLPHLSCDLMHEVICESLFWNCGTLALLFMMKLNDRFLVI